MFYKVNAMCFKKKMKISTTKYEQHLDCRPVVKLPVPTAGLFRLVYLWLPSLAPLKVREVLLFILQFF